MTTMEAKTQEVLPGEENKQISPQRMHQLQACPGALSFQATPHLSSLVAARALGWDRLLITLSSRGHSKLQCACKTRAEF